MTALVALCVIFALILLAVVVVLVFVLAGKANRQLAEYAGEEHARNLETCQALVKLTETWGNAIADAALRETEDTRLVISSLVAERRQLIHALLAANVDPRAAQRLGMIDQAAARDDRADRVSLREELAFLTQDDGRARETETTDDQGKPIIPVGLG